MLTEQNKCNFFPKEKKVRSEIKEYLIEVLSLPKEQKSKMKGQTGQLITKAMPEKKGGSWL